MENSTFQNNIAEISIQQYNDTFGDHKNPLLPQELPYSIFKKAICEVEYEPVATDVTIEDLMDKLLSGSSDDYDSNYGFKQLNEPSNVFLFKTIYGYDISQANLVQIVEGMHEQVELKLMAGAGLVNSELISEDLTHFDDAVQLVGVVKSINIKLGV